MERIRLPYKPMSYVKYVLCEINLTKSNMNQNYVMFKYIYEYIVRNKTTEQSESTRQVYHVTLLVADGIAFQNSDICVKT